MTDPSRRGSTAPAPSRKPPVPRGLRRLAGLLLALAGLSLVLSGLGALLQR